MRHGFAWCRGLWVLAVTCCGGGGGGCSIKVGGVLWSTPIVQCGRGGGGCGNEGPKSQIPMPCF